MSASTDKQEIERLLQTIADVTKSYKRSVSQLNWQLARTMARFRDKYGSSASAKLIESLKGTTDSDEDGGSSESKLQKMPIIGHFSAEDLSKMGIPDVDPFVFLQHKSAFVDHKTKQLIHTEEGKAVLSALQNGASDFELRKLRKKGTRY